MIRINKSAPPNPLTIFAAANPGASWDHFRDYNSGESYKLLQDLIFKDQYQLCAYCEINTGTILQNKRVEHFVSKSLDVAHHTDWFNIFGVCVGGSDHINKNLYSLPSNLSCDSHKSHFENKNKAHEKNWNGIILNPLSIPKYHNFFTFDKSTGSLLANQEYCDQNNIEDNKHSSTLILINKTIEILNLNCERLCLARREILFNFLRMQKQARKKNDIYFLKEFAISWLSGPVKEFQTTRNIILRENNLIKKMLGL